VGIDNKKWGTPKTKQENDLNWQKKKESGKTRKDGAQESHRIKKPKQKPKRAKESVPETTAHPVHSWE